jgi:hypothetical protein
MIKLLYFLLRLLPILFTLLLLLVPYIPVSAAMTDPDLISMVSVRVFQNLAESGDQMIIMEHECDYTTTPSVPSQSAFLVAIEDAEDTVLYEKPLYYYDYSLTGIYLTKAEALVWDSTDYKAVISGQPGYFPTLTEGVNKSTLNFEGSTWIPGNQEESRGYLQSWLSSIAEAVANYSGISVLNSDGVFTNVGSTMFTTCVPGLESICPGLYASASASYLPTSTTTGTNVIQGTYNSRQSNRLMAAFEGIGTFFLGHSGLGLVIGGVGFGVLFFILAGRIYVATGSIPIAISVSLPFIIAGNIIGVIPMVFTFIVGFLVIILFGITFVLARLG